MAPKYAQIHVFVCGHYISIPRSRQFCATEVKENVEHVELRETDDVQGQISEHVFKVKWRLLRLLSFKYSSQGSFENWGISDDVPQF